MENTTHFEKTERSYTQEEIQLLKNRKYSLWQHFENFGMKWIGIIIISLLPLLAYNKFIQKVSSEIQLWILIPLLLFSVYLTLYWMKKNGEIEWNKKIENEIKYGKAEVLYIKTNKVIKRRETFDLGSGFYIKISKNKTLYLQGQHFDEMQYSQKFPNTEFEISRTSSENSKLLNISFFGEYLKPEKKLKAFTKEEFENNKVHYDGDLLNIPIEQIN